MNAVLEFPSIAAGAAVQTAPQVPATLKATVLAQFAAIKPEITALGAKYANVAYDVKTTKGMNDAKAARLELREKGRFMLQRTEKRIKDEANDLKRVVADEVAALVKIIEPVETAIHEQITAEETRKAEEKAKAEKAEAERKQKLQDGIAGIRAMLERAAGQPPEKIEAAIKAMEAWTFPAERWQEFAHEAADATCKTIEKLRQLHAQAVEAARLAAENERLRAELAARAPEVSEFCKEDNTRAALAALDAANAPVVTGNVASENTTTLPGGAVADASTGEIIAGPGRLTFDDAGHGTVAVDAAVTNTQGQDSQQVLKAEPETADATDRESPANTSPRVGAMGAGQPADAGPVAEEAEPATLKLGDINARLNPLKIDAAGLEAIGIKHAERKGVAYLYRESDWPRIKQAIVEWIGRLD